MLLIIHILLGALIGIKFHSVILIILLSFLTHFFLDIIPHWDMIYNKKEKELFENSFKIKITKKAVGIIILDFFLAIWIMNFLFNSLNNQNIILGSIVAISPDIIKIGYFTKMSKNKYYKKYLLFHSKIQRDVNWRLGILTQIITGIIIILVL